MEEQPSTRSQTYHNRFSIVLAFVALSLALGYLLPEVENPNSVTVLGVQVELSGYTLLPWLVAAISMIGAYWVMITHERFYDGTAARWKLAPNLVIPFLTILVFSLVLKSMDRGIAWWFVFIFGVVLYGVNLLGEYAVIDTSLRFVNVFAIVLIALSHGLFLILCIALNTANTRLYIQLPVMALASGFVAFRTIHLRGDRQWKLTWIIIIALIVVELGAGLSYLFISPIQFGLILCGAQYSLGSLGASLTSQDKKRMITEPVVMAVITLVLVVGAAFI